MVCLISALGGLLFGLDQGFIANSLATIEKLYGLSLDQGEHYSAVFAWGGILGALFSGLLVRWFGRKKILIAAGFIFTAASLVSAFISPFQLLTACRFLLGLAVGLASFTVPLYLSETAPTPIRGAMATLFQLMITTGIFLIALSNVSIVKLWGHAHISLTLMFSVIVIFAAIMFIGAFTLPESPRWLVLKGKHKEALTTLAKLRASAGSWFFLENLNCGRITANVSATSGY
jgi:SP family galactose:H+ symporter-like MFS transporter